MKELVLTEKLISDLRALSSGSRDVSNASIGKLSKLGFLLRRKDTRVYEGGNVRKIPNWRISSAGQRLLGAEESPPAHFVPAVVHPSDFDSSSKR